MREPAVILRTESGWVRPANFIRELRATSLDEVLPALREAEAAADAGKFVVAFITYETSPAFDPALAARPAAGLPLAWFAIYESASPFGVPPLGGNGNQPNVWQPSISEQTYAEKIDAIRAAIARGETYQVNFTFPLLADFSGEAQALFAQLAASQRGDYSAFIETDDFAICSASPELFFALDGDAITCRPMKGTAKRGRSTAEDDALADQLSNSTKDRAENLMIVDMVRNDLGRIAETGTVQTTRLFDIERYPTVLQMTSTVAAKTRAPVTEIFRALFPSASITGAPKVRTTKIISELEAAPRGVYCGSIGYIAPGRRAQFNVAIRTVQINKRTARARFDTGSGIVWDSSAANEYAECITKTAILDAPTRPDFQLLETLRRDTSSDWKFLDAHLARLAASARYFGFPFDEQRIRTALQTGLGRVRLLLDSSGKPTVESAPLKLPGHFADRPTPNIPFMSAAIANALVSSKDVFLFHKTTHRAAYERAKASCPGVEEVLLVNERDELTEGTIGNIVLHIGDEFLTPPLDCGLLPGIFRAELLARGAIREAVLSSHDIHRANAAYLINSVRGWTRLAMRA